jgi:8-amino-7-oxononanoate synthase
MRRMLEGPQGTIIRLNNRNVCNFCSNDYLGFANHPVLKAAVKHGVDKYGVGSGASQLICGYSVAHRMLEDKLSELTGRQRAILFSTGYMANLALVNTLLDKTGLVFADRLNHASLLDAALLARTRVKRFNHVDSASLRSLLHRANNKQKLVMTDTVFSMDGDLAPLPEYISVCCDTNAMLIVDDAHGFGVFGKNGGGTLEEYNLAADQVPLLMATFGKALGTFGSFIAGDSELLEIFIQRARTLIYTTAPPPALAYATVCALDLLQQEQWRREKLQQLIARFTGGARQLALPVKRSISPIQALIVGEDINAVDVSNRLLKKGIYVCAIRPPTVPEGTARLRISLTAEHTETQVDQLLETLHDILVLGHA